MKSYGENRPFRARIQLCRKLEVGYRIDLVVEGRVVVEVKSVEALHPIFEAQLLSYMRLSGFGVGLLINFNVLHLRAGIKRMVDGQDWQK
jgi:GxxExxY protein